MNNVFRYYQKECDDGYMKNYIIMINVWLKCFVELVNHY